MEFDNPVKLTSSLAKLLQYFCNGHVEFQAWAQVIGTLSLVTENGQCIAFSVNEKVVRLNNDSYQVSTSSFHLSHSQCDNNDESRNPTPAIKGRNDEESTTSSCNIQPSINEDIQDSNLDSCSVHFQIDEESTTSNCNIQPSINKDIQDSNLDSCSVHFQIDEESTTSNCNIQPSINKDIQDSNLDSCSVHFQTLENPSVSSSLSENFDTSLSVIPSSTANHSDTTNEIKDQNESASSPNKLQKNRRKRPPTRIPQTNIELASEDSNEDNGSPICQVTDSFTLTNESYPSTSQQEMIDSESIDIKPVISAVGGNSSLNSKGMYYFNDFS